MCAGHRGGYYIAVYIQHFEVAKPYIAFDIIPVIIRYAHAEVYDLPHRRKLVGYGRICRAGSGIYPVKLTHGHGILRRRVGRICPAHSQCGYACAKRKRKQKYKYSLFH